MFGIYSVLERFYYLEDCEYGFTCKEYCDKFEVSRRTFYRDLDMLLTLKNIKFTYNRYTRRYKKELENGN